MKCLDRLFGRRTKQPPATHAVHPVLRRQRSVPQIIPRSQRKEHRPYPSRSAERLKHAAQDRRSNHTHTPRSQHQRPLASPASVRPSHRSSRPPAPPIIITPAATPALLPRTHRVAPPGAVHLSAPASYRARDLCIPWTGIVNIRLDNPVFLSDCARILANAPHLRAATFEHVRADAPEIAPLEYLVLSQRFHTAFHARAHMLEVLRLLDVRCDITRLLGALDAPVLAHLEVRYTRSRRLGSEERSEILRYVRTHDKMYRQRMCRFLQTLKIRGTRLENALAVFTSELFASGVDSERVRGLRDQRGYKIARGFDIA